MIQCWFLRDEQVYLLECSALLARNFFLAFFCQSAEARAMLLCSEGEYQCLLHVVEIDCYSLPQCSGLMPKGFFTIRFNSFTTSKNRISSLGVKAEASQWANQRSKKKLRFAFDKRFIYNAICQQKPCYARSTLYDSDHPPLYASIVYITDTFNRKSLIP